eukprot:1143406-Pelagomonas_calceolata.AAC.10
MLHWLKLGPWQRHVVPEKSGCLGNSACASSKLESSNDGQQVPSVPSLKPRLTSSLAHELD